MQFVDSLSGYGIDCSTTADCMHFSGFVCCPPRLEKSRKAIVSMNKKIFETAMWLGLAALLTPGILSAQAANPEAFARGAQGGPGRGFAGPPDTAPKGPAPLNSEGKPDISGAWEPNAIRLNVDMVATGIHPPFQPWAEKLYNERKANISKDDPEARCLPPGVPRMSTTPYPFRIMWTPKLTLIVYEGGAHIWRQVFTDGRKHSEDPNPSWLGESIGTWDGDTFVIDTVGFNGKSWIDESGLPTTDKLHVIERIKRVDAGHLEIEHTVDDPGAYTGPWKFTTHPRMLKGELMEYICQENNRDVEHLVGSGK